MKNINFQNEIVSGAVWVARHSYDRDLKFFLKELSNPEYNHENRYSMLKEWMKKYYPGVQDSIILGISLTLED